MAWNYYEKSKLLSEMDLYDATHAESNGRAPRLIEAAIGCVAEGVCENALKQAGLTDDEAGNRQPSSSMLGSRCAATCSTSGDARAAEQLLNMKARKRMELMKRLLGGG